MGLRVEDGFFVGLDAVCVRAVVRCVEQGVGRAESEMSVRECGGWLQGWGRERCEGLRVRRGWGVERRARRGLGIACRGCGRVLALELAREGRLACVVVGETGAWAWARPCGARACVFVFERVRDLTWSCVGMRVGACASGCGRV